MNRRSRLARGPFPRAALATAASLCLLATARCADSAGPDERLLTGADVPIGNGLARVEAVVNAAGQPVSMAVVLTPGALDGLPPTLPNTEFVVPLPAEATGTPFDHVAINWAPMGHPPPGTYTHPHFDVHFYLIGQQERDAITPADPAFGAKAAKHPSAGFAPPGYNPDAIGIPRMGNHWTDPTGPEFQGHGFTHTFVYGFYDGVMVFLEPMVTRHFWRRERNRPVRWPCPNTIRLPERIRRSTPWAGMRTGASTGSS